MKTRGQLEAEIGEAITNFEREYMGRGPEETKTYILGDMILVRLRGVLTPAEKNLAKSEGPAKGRILVKQMRIELLEQGRPMLEELIKDLTGKKLISLHTDLSTKTGERVVIFTLEAAPEMKVPRVQP